MSLSKVIERVYSALHLEEPDRVPLFELLIDPPIVEEILSVKMPNRCTIWAYDLNLRGRCVEKVVLNTLKCYEKVGLDVFPVPVLYGPSYPIKRISESTYLDEWWTIWKWVKVDGYEYPSYFNGAADTVEKYLEFEPPEPLLSERFKALEIALKERRKVVVAAILNDVFSLAWRMRRLDRFLVDVYRNKDVISKVMDKVTSFIANLTECVLDMGVEIVIFGDDYGDSKGPFMSPKIFKELVFPRLRRLVRMVKRRGVPVVKHCCGKIYRLLNEFVKIGIDGIHPLWPMDLKRVKEEFGSEICLIGNVDVDYTLSLAPNAEVGKVVREKIKAAAPGGGYMISSSNSISFSVKTENFLEMVKQSIRFGIYGKKVI